MKRKKLLLISLDALCESDLSYVQELPNFSRIMREGAWCPREVSVYPSLTFPCHASIATGCNPGSHGIVNNYLFEPFEKLHKWNFYAANLKRKAIWDYASAAGLRVMSMSWPVSAGADMAYSMPEMSPAKPKIWNMANFLRQLDVFRKYGTPRFAIRALLSRRELPKAWFLGKQPQLDQAMMQCFEEAIRKEDFDIALLHIYGLDDAKHCVGTTGPQVQMYLRAYDRFIGRLIKYSEERTDENVTLLFTGDHGQKDVKYAIFGNMLLEKLGLLTYADGNLKDYQIYMDSCDGMAYLYMQEGADEEAFRQAVECFRNVPGVKKVMLPEEFAGLGCDRYAAAVLEAEDSYSFESGYEPRAREDENRTIISEYKGLHGYLPDADDYRTMFFSFGQDVAAKEIDKMRIIDILPTILAWFGIKPDSDMDGQAVDGVWKSLP